MGGDVRFALCLCALLVFLGFSYHRGADSYLRINDHLDGFVPFYRVLSQYPILGPLEYTVEPIAGGLPRNALPTTVHLGVLPYFLVEPLAALAWNELVARAVAFLGMFLLLRRRLLPDAPDLVVHGASLCFALLPFLPAGYLSVAGQPWLLHALWNVRDGRGRLPDWLVIGIFPFDSVLAWVGFFVLLGLGVFVGYESLRRRRLPGGLAVALGLMTLFYAASEYRLLHQTFLDPDYVSFRSEYDFRDQPFLWAGYKGVQNFLFSQHHAASAQFPFVLTTVGLALLAGLAGVRRRGVLAFVREARSAPSSSTPSRTLALLLLVVLCGVIALGVGLYDWSVVQGLIRSTGLSALRMFNFHRFQWFHPLLFALAFAFALDILRRGRWGRRAALSLLLLQGVWLVATSDPVRVRREVGVSYREFYSPALFREIRAHIGRPMHEYRVVGFGLIPGIPLFNGFHTLDGFLSNYPLEYKHRFRRVIAGELERDPWLRHHYDNWGAHVHLYSTELGMVVGYRKKGLHTKNGPIRAVNEVRIDTAALKELGCDYVLSAVEIRNHRALGLRLERRFERGDSPWEIFLYAL